MASGNHREWGRVRGRIPSSPTMPAHGGATRAGNPCRKTSGSLNFVRPPRRGVPYRPGLGEVAGRADVAAGAGREAETELQPASQTGRLACAMKNTVAKGQLSKAMSLRDSSRTASAPEYLHRLAHGFAHKPRYGHVASCWGVGSAQSFGPLSREAPRMRAQTGEMTSTGSGGQKSATTFGPGAHDQLANGAPPRRPWSVTSSRARSGRRRRRFDRPRIRRRTHHQP